MNPFARSRRILIFAVLVLPATAGVSIYYKTLHRPLPELHDGIVEIKHGWSLAAISKVFFGASRFHGGIFKLHAILTGNSRRLKAGEYLQEKETIYSLVRKLVDGKVLQYRVTVAEGVWAEDIATLLAGAGLGDREKFLTLIRDPGYVRALAGPDAPNLEGYLFPETYFFTKGMTESEILKAFVARFNEKARPVLELPRPSVHSNPMTPHEALILASMVEREAAVDEERPVIAAVFLNRLNRRMPMESCVTVEYAMGRKKKQLTEDDLKVDSPYNTYRHPGLPPGPVGNPGLKAIRAVMAPADTRYLFFVAQGDGRHVFSRTWAEHKQAKKSAALIRRQRRPQ